MSETTVSVVVVSRNRPSALRRCLVGLSQLRYPAFEIVVVADPAGIAAARGGGFGETVKLLEYDVPNISAARNLGITQAAGDIVAFIDDDAVPEPLWLHHLTAPASRAEVAAMGGYVRGRNGISFQWKARGLDRQGSAYPLSLHDACATVLTPPHGHAVKTEGTNMAFRRDALIALDGFDPAFHYYLDETDLNMRLARTGQATVIVPRAEVHHGFEENRVRSSDRVPGDLFDIGASWAVFARKHIHEADRAAHWKTVQAAERRRLLRHMVSGALEPRSLRRLMARLEQGHSEGLVRAIGTARLPRRAASPFMRYVPSTKPHVWITTRPARWKRDEARALKLVRQGHVVTLLSLSPSAFYHRVAFTEEGVWRQTGGLFGRSERDQPLVSFHRRKFRSRTERERVTFARGDAIHR